jgi:hypothetical protein
MANKNQAMGLRPHGRELRIRPYVAGSTIYAGAAVTLSSDGQVDAATSGKLLGVAKNYALVNQTVYVYDDPQQLFQVEGDTAVAVTDIGLNCTLNAGTDSTLYKRSGQTADIDGTMADTLTLSLQILGHVPQADNTVNAANNDIIVRINAHQLQAIGQLGI